MAPWVHFKCQKCGEPLRATPDQVGKLAQCIKCRTCVIVPPSDSRYLDLRELDDPAAPAVPRVAPGAASSEIPLDPIETPETAAGPDFTPSRRPPPVPKRKSHFLLLIAVLVGAAPALFVLVVWLANRSSAPAHVTAPVSQVAQPAANARLSAAGRATVAAANTAPRIKEASAAEQTNSRKRAPETKPDPPKPAVRADAPPVTASTDQRQSVATTEEEGASVYRTVLQSTVLVFAETVDGRMGMGSGSLVDAAQRMVLTNFHVVDGAMAIRVLFPRRDSNGKLISEAQPYLQLLRSKQGIKASVFKKQARVDLAIIQLESLPPRVEALPLAREGATPGQKVYSIGNPGAGLAAGSLWILTEGTVRQVYHAKIQTRGEKGDRPFTVDAEMILSSSPTNPGDSGGPLVNGRGELVGVTQALDPEARQMSLFIEQSEVKKFLTDNAVSFTVGRK